MTETMLMSWTSPYGDHTIEIWDLGTVFQVRDRVWGGEGSEILARATLAEARIVARMKAETLVLIQG